jgi:hypothetical protein
MLLFFGCAHLVDVSVTAASIAPTMSNGAQWDGPDRVAPEVGGLLSTMVNAVDPTGQLTRAAAETVAQKAAPDPFGTVTLRSTDAHNGETRPLTLLAEDSLTPDWSAAPATFERVKLTGDVRLTVSLTDDDVVTDDPVGTVEIDNVALRYALREGKAEVDVRSQSSGQLQSVTVKVVRAKK